MSKTASATRVAPADGWRADRRREARQAIVAAAWRLVRAEGLASLAIRDLAEEAGITTPTVYAYFDSKHAVYDAMFGEAATEFLGHMTAPYDTTTPRDLLAAGAKRFVAFCVSDPPRYQLLFQRTILGFEPSSESYAPAVEALASSRQRLAANGIRSARHVDLWTALTTGLVDQQISNDPGGSRWSALVDEAVDMFIAHCEATKTRPKGSRNDH
jgi:AcrR family transcriptional regulator